MLQRSPPCGHGSRGDHERLAVDGAVERAPRARSPGRRARLPLRFPAELDCEVHLDGVLETAAHQRARAVSSSRHRPSVARRHGPRRAPTCGRAARARLPPRCWQSSRSGDPRIAAPCEVGRADARRGRGGVSRRCTPARARSAAAAPGSLARLAARSGAGSSLRGTLRCSRVLDEPFQRARSAGEPAAWTSSPRLARAPGSSSRRARATGSLNAFARSIATSSREAADDYRKRTRAAPA